MKKYDVVIVGGGASGFFSAINIAENRPDLKIAILEKNKEGLQKVKISGGGRCNVTHAEFIPSELVKNYPRGEKELLGPFHSFMTGDVMEWFEMRGVPLKIEADGRVFPKSNTSQTIIDCFLTQAKKHQITVLYSQNVTKISSSENTFQLQTTTTAFSCQKLVIASGSSPKMWQLLEKLNHTIVPPVPSLFTFNCTDARIANIAGLAVKNIKLKICNSALSTEGDLLVTHWGLSGPAVLKLSAWGAKILAEKTYCFNLQVNFVNRNKVTVTEELTALKIKEAKKIIAKNPVFELPKRLWLQLVLAAKIPQDLQWAALAKTQLVELVNQLTNATFKIDGKSTFKDEFVTAGGVDLKQINFKTFESKVCGNLYFAGEVLDIDAITGGFNFQNAWTSAFLAAQSICNETTL